MDKSLASMRAQGSRNESESSSIHELLQNVEANDLNSDVNEEIPTLISPSITNMSDEHSENPPTNREESAALLIGEALSFEMRNRHGSTKTEDSNDMKIAGPTGFGRKEDTERSELECDTKFRKPSRISYDERLTVICDSSQGSSPAHTPSPTQDHVPPNFDQSTQRGLFGFFADELTRGYSLHNDQSRYSEKRRKVYAFLRIPLELERFLGYGLLQCIDSFFYLFTFLPLRFFMSIIGSLLRIKSWTSAETCDLIKVFIIVCSSVLISGIDSSYLYHQVRSQSVVKLYIFYNMLEVADRLFSSLGQDILDALFWTANSGRFSARYVMLSIIHLAVAVGYATMHTFLVILQATTLNVAFNSHNQALLAIMMSNNFVELKGSVFKKFAKANLFQMACSDVRERFHIFALVFVVMIRNLMAVNWSAEPLGEMLPDILMVVLAELLVDWLKHAFITKFNEINSEVYKDFTITIAFDVIRSRETSAFSDYSDQVSRRMGFIPIPLSIMMIHVISQTFSIDDRASVFICVVGWLLMFAIKICNGVIMLGKACRHVKKFRDFQARAEYDLFRKRMVEKKSKSAPNSPRMSLIDFTDVLHQPAAGKGFTVSDMLSQWDDLQPLTTSEPRRSTDRELSVGRNDDRTPRRARSMASIARRDRSEPPPNCEDSAPPSVPLATSAAKVDEEMSTTSTTQKDRVKENSGQMSPKKRVATGTTCHAADDSDLADVTAYKMPEQGVQRIE